MKLYTISIVGCDDSTVFTMALTDDEFKCIERLCKNSKDISTYGCMPTMEIKESTGGEIE